MLVLAVRLRRVRRPTAPRLRNIAPMRPKIAPDRPKSRPASSKSGVAAKPPDRIRLAQKNAIEPCTCGGTRARSRVPTGSRAPLPTARPQSARPKPRV